MAEKRITEAEFSMQCSFIAKNAAAWAGDLLTLPEHYNREAYTDTVARFTDEIRSRLDRLDAWAGRSDVTRINPRASHHFGTAAMSVRRDGSIVLSFGDPRQGRHEQFDFEGSKELAEFIVSLVNATIVPSGGDNADH